MNLKLSNREITIVRLIAGGKSNKMVAEELALSIKTIINHRARIYTKLEVHCTADCVRKALKMKVITIEEI